MNWLLPWALGAAAAAAIGVTLLHLLARDRPQRWLLPTARFVSPGTARATRRARTPRDMMLLALRVLALVLAGAAFAGPVLSPEGGRVARVVLLDRSGAGDARAALDSARARMHAGDRLVLLDSTATIVPPGQESAWLDSARALPVVGPAAESPALGGTRAPLSAGIIAAVRAAAEIGPYADSVLLSIVAPSGDADAALTHVRALWPGRAETVNVVPAQRAASFGGVAADSPSGVSRRPSVRGAPGDAVVAGARLAGAVLAGGGGAPRGAATMLIRMQPTTSDSAFAREGGTLLVWPGDTASAAGMAPRATPDTIGGFIAGDAAVLYAAARAHVPPQGRVVARWIDGAPAITEAAHGRGCIRTAAIVIPPSGDLTLRPAFQRAMQALLAPCAVADPRPLSDSTRVLLAGEGPLARAGDLRASAARSPATPWLLGLALLLLLLEPLLRRPDASAATGAAA